MRSFVGGHDPARTAGHTDGDGPSKVDRRPVEAGNGSGPVDGRLILMLQASAGNAAVSRTLARSSPAETARRGPVSVQRDQSNEQTLAAIQGSAMFALLPKLAQLPPEVRKDEAAGYKVGGPRLVTAMRVVAAQGTPWLDFADSHNSELAQLPEDQIHDIMVFLGAPNEARYYKSSEFSDLYDGAVDPVQGIITIFLRVKIEVIGAQFGDAAPGTPGWQEQTQAGKQRFVAEFERIVEQQWSGQGTVRPACPVGSVKEFKTQLRVQMVEDNPHATFAVLPDPTGGGRSNRSTLKVGDTQEKKPETRQVSDPTGKRPVTVTNTQVTASHEVGHVLNLSHVRCEGDQDACYGVTAEERRDMMGAGHALQVIVRSGKVMHDDFQPFEKVGERWGRDVFPGALAGRCNRWSAQAGK